MNRLYYSNFCPHSKDVLEFIRKNGLIDKLDFFCVDNRVQNPQTGIIYIISEDKKTRTPLPPNIQEVPALLLVREQYRAILGKEITNYYAPQIKNVFSEINTPQPISLTDSTQTFSNYGDVDDQNNTNKKQYIETPPEDFINNKIGNNVTVDLIEKQRNEDLEKLFAKSTMI
jgi:hypothetical protein